MLCDGWSAARRKSGFVSRGVIIVRVTPFRHPGLVPGSTGPQGGKRLNHPPRRRVDPERVRVDGVGVAGWPKQERRPLPGPPLLTPKQTASLLPRALRVFVIARRGRRVLAVDRLRRRQRIARVHRLVQPASSRASWSSGFSSRRALMASSCPASCRGLRSWLLACSPSGATDRLSSARSSIPFVIPSSCEYGEERLPDRFRS